MCLGVFSIFLFCKEATMLSCLYHGSERMCNRACLDGTFVDRLCDVVHCCCASTHSSWESGVDC